MAKKILIFLVISLLLSGVLGFYKIFKYRAEKRLGRQNAKAPQISVTFLEGWGNRDIADYLQKNGIVSSADFLAAAKDFKLEGYPILASKPQTSGLEGFLFPDTYFISKNLSPGAETGSKIIKKSLDNFTAKFTPAMQIQAEDDKLSVYQIVTLASIIEKETRGNQEERKIVAGIFYNRLKAGVPLQSDATVNYVTGKSDLRPSRADTDIDSSYNTYKYKGLPPGPICNPGLDAIMAALTPAKTDYFYFLTDPKTGRAVFAKTYDEHLKNKQKYLR